MPGVGHLSCLELVTCHVLSWARLMPRVGHLSCLELGTFDLACLELGFLDASSWAPLMLRVGFPARSWAPDASIYASS